MPDSAATVSHITAAPTWDDRVARIRQVPQHHGTNEHAALYAEIARQLYVPHLAPDFAYVHPAPFYELPCFEAAYAKTDSATSGFRDVAAAHLHDVLEREPTTLLVLRTITGLTRTEFAAATRLIAEPAGLTALTAAKVDAMERTGSPPTPNQARVAAETIDALMAGTLFGDPPGELRSKLDKSDTADGWQTVRTFAANGAPYPVFLHQRHYGGAFRQLLDATSTHRGNLLEDAVEALFVSNGIPHVRTGSHNQGQIESMFEVTVRPAPDFVVHDGAGALRAMLECKGANDGGTARDKALRFATLRAEAQRLGGVPLLAVIGGLGWTRVNDTLGPVVRDCDGRVFTLANLAEMLTVTPFPQLAGPPVGPDG